MDLIDTHQHLIYQKKASYSWAKDIPALQSDFTVEDYHGLTQDYNILGTLFMECAVDDPDYKSESNFINSLMQKSNNGIKGLILSIRPEDDSEFDKWLEESKSLGVVGYRRVLHTEPDELSQQNNFRENINKIGKEGKPFDLCFREDQLKLAIELSKSCDEMDLILNHCGVPAIASGEMEEWKKDISALSELKHVTCKLSGLMAYCAPGTASYETIKPYVDHVLQCFGPDRMVWGSDWPVVNLAKGLTEWLGVTKKIMSNLTSEEAAKIANINAKKIYNI
ncbi:amidohydrolase family protein [Pelagibacteraceae bacterium]|nr:amidohydrolase family protein [Pelagibacteraceae bacterium]MDC3156369.1 amidohydrolase family protein [Pelagibacteraceae bacterium]